MKREDTKNNTPIRGIIPVAHRPMEAEVSPAAPPWAAPEVRPAKPGEAGPTYTPPAPALPRRFHASVTLDTARVGRDAGRIDEEVIAHLSGLVGAEVTVTLEIHAEVPSGAADTVVCIVTENCRTLKFSDHGFETE